MFIWLDHACQTPSCFRTNSIIFLEARRRKWFDASSIRILKIQLHIKEAINKKLHEEFKIFAKLVTKLIYHAHKTPSLDPESYESRLHALARTYTDTHNFNHSLSVTPRSPKWSIPFSYSNQNPDLCEVFLCVYMFRPSLPPRAVTLTISGELYKLRTFSLHNSSTGWYFFSLSLQHFHQRLVLKHYGGERPVQNYTLN